MNKQESDSYGELSQALWKYLESFGQLGWPSEVVERKHDEIMEAVEEAAEEIETTTVTEYE